MASLVCGCGLGAENLVVYEVNEDEDENRGEIPKDKKKSQDR